MAEQPLITSWTDYAAAAERLLAKATRSVSIFDHDLASLRLERPATIASLTHFLRASPSSTLRIVVHTAAPLRSNCPRLMDLLSLFAHKFHVCETPPHLANLADSMLLIDQESGLIRFHRDHARSKEIIDDPQSAKPYCKRFEDLWEERGPSVSATTTGL